MKSFLYKKLEISKHDKWSDLESNNAFIFTNKCITSYNQMLSHEDLSWAVALKKNWVKKQTLIAFSDKIFVFIEKKENAIWFLSEYNTFKFCA